jgi:hypothetical protein
LAADATQIERRNLDYSEISRRLVFQLGPEYPDYVEYVHANPWVSSSVQLNDLEKATMGKPEPIKTTCSVFDTE